MVRLAVKDLFQERGRLLISLGGVAATLVLILLLEGIFAGTSEQIVAYPQETDAEVWVMQKGVSNMHMAVSILPGDLEATVRDVPGVEGVTLILYTSNFVEKGEQRWLSYLVGLQKSAARGGPWAMAEGVAIPGPGEAVVPDVLARKSGLKLGDSVTIMGRQFRVAGLSKETFSMANSITFLSYSDLEDLLGISGVASYVLVKGDPGVRPDVLAQRMGQEVSTVNVMTRDTFVASDRDMARQMGVDIIRVMTLVGFVVGALIIGLTMYTATASKAREYGIIKAIGAGNRYLLSLVAFQTLTIALLSLGVAVAVAHLARPVVEALVPEIALVYPTGSLVKLAAASVGIAFLASLLPAYRIARVEPAAVFKE